MFKLSIFCCIICISDYFRKAISAASVDVLKSKRRFGFPSPFLEMSAQGADISTLG